MNVAQRKKISPSVLKVLSLATAAMASNAMSERWGASSSEMADRQWHLEVRACLERVKLKSSASAVRGYTKNMYWFDKANSFVIYYLFVVFIEHSRAGMSLKNVPIHSYLTEWACHWQQSLWVKGIRLKCIWTHLQSSVRIERKICVYMWIWIILLDAVFMAAHIFRAPESKTSGTKLKHTPRG